MKILDQSESVKLSAPAIPLPEGPHRDYLRKWLSDYEINNPDPINFESNYLPLKPAAVPNANADRLVTRADLNGACEPLTERVAELEDVVLQLLAERGSNS